MTICLNSFIYLPVYLTVQPWITQTSNLGVGETFHEIPNELNLIKAKIIEQNNKYSMNQTDEGSR